MLLNCQGDWGLGLGSKAAGLEASPSNYPRTETPAMAMNLGEHAFIFYPQQSPRPPGQPTDHNKDNCSCQGWGATSHTLGEVGT